MSLRQGELAPTHDLPKTPHRTPYQPSAISRQLCGTGLMFVAQASTL
ncbi:MAG: hypothetical protein F6K56_19465 [Moorea sp. SIO3G5]|nr:hypothetical protein [Moorena sp. SIO3G5]